MKRLLIVLIILAVSAPAVADETIDLALQYGKLKVLKTYYEGKVEDTVIRMNGIEKRFAKIKQDQKKAQEESDEKDPVDPDND